MDQWNKKPWLFGEQPWPDNFLEECRRFFEDVEPGLEPGLDLYPEVFETPLFFPLQRQRELGAIIRLARPLKPKVVMEIGADKGGGLYHWCKCFPSVRKAVAIEIRGLPYGRLFEQAFPDTAFCWLECSSYAQSTVKCVRGLLHEDLVDVLFIDGDKLGTRKDYDAYAPLVRPGGLIFIHDVNGDDPGKAFEAIDHPRKSIVLDQSECHEAAEREARGEPVTTAYEGWLRHWKGRSCGVGVIEV
jgi:hypothetical protein